MYKQALSKHLPDVLVNKIIYLLLSYGTPSSQMIRDYIEQNMHKLPVQFDDNNRTIWRYRAYSCKYSFLTSNGLTRKGLNYHTDVRYETILALIESNDCLVALRSQNVLGDLINFTKFTLRKLFEIRMHILKKASSEGCGTPTALLMKKHFKDMKIKELLK